MTAEDKRTQGCYIAHSDDWSQIAAFSSEIEALRYAVAGSMRVDRVPFGVDIREHVTPSVVGGQSGSATAARPKPDQVAPNASTADK